MIPGVDTSGCERARSLCCNASVGVNRAARYVCLQCERACSIDLPAGSVIDDINRRSKGAALAEEIRVLLPLMSESDRFALFGLVTDGYCVTCGADLNITACGCQWG